MFRRRGQFQPRVEISLDSLCQTWGNLSDNLIEETISRFLDESGGQALDKFGKLYGNL